MSVEARNTATESSTPRDRKVGLSCAECRRSKLKCDRVFPCQSCIRRGCAAICPDGTLAATKGNKVLMAHAQRLTEQVKTLSSRVQELENALSEAHFEGSGVHPLLRRPSASDSNLDAAEVWDGGLQDVSEAIGSLSIGLDGRAKYHGETAGSEYFQDLLPLTEEEWQSPEPKQLGLPFEIINLMNAFPFGLNDCPYTKLLFVPFLPTRERAIELADLYYKNAAWMYDPIVQQDFIISILDPIYGTTGFASLNALHSHRLSVFFILLASGILYDSHPSASDIADKYHALARAAISLDSILQEATCATVQALFMMLRFKYNSDRSSNEARWLLTGLCARVSQAIGLQRDSAGWNLDPEEIQRRRIMFWEMYTYDAWSSVVYGRPPSLMIQHTDCRFPDDLDPSVKSSGETEIGWHAWKFRYSAACLSISVQHIFSTKVARYSALLELDKKIRKHPLPSHLQSPVQASDVGRSWSPDPSRAMQQYSAVCERESNLLYIHRSYFAQAIREESTNPLQHKYAASVLATYRSACRIISSLQSLYLHHPKPASICWFFWSAIFSSCVVLGALIVESPGCTLAQDALREFERALPLYEEGSRPCRPPGTLAMLQKLQQRAYSTFAAFHTGLGDSSHKTPKDTDAPDELAVLGGRKSVIQNKSASNSPSSIAAAGSPSHQEVCRESSEESSLGSQPGAGDELMDYYQELGNPGFGRDHDMEGLPVPFAEISSYPMQAESGIPSVMPKGVSAQALIDQFLATPAPLLKSQCPPVTADQDPSPGPTQGRVRSLKSTHIRPAPYSHPQHYPQPGLQSGLMLPQHTTQLSDQHTNALGFVTGQEQNQDEIWRNFIREFGLES